MNTTAEKDVIEYLKPGETVEAVVFGPYGWNGYGQEQVIAPIPESKQGIVLTWDEARPMMQTWTFYGGYGSPDCYAVTIWTNERVIWVTQYDGSTQLDSAPRTPVPHIPYMPGG